MATSIGALNVALTMNTAAFVADTGKARTAVTSMSAEFNRTAAVIDRASGALLHLGLHVAGAYTAVRLFHTTLAAFKDVAALTPAKLDELGISIDQNIIERARRAETILTKLGVTAKIALVESLTSIPNPFKDFQNMLDAARGITRPNISKQPFANESTQGFVGNAFLDAQTNSTNVALLSQSPMQKYHKDQADAATKAADEAQSLQQRFDRDVIESQARFLKGWKITDAAVQVDWNALYTGGGVAAGEFVNAQREMRDEIQGLWDDYYQRQSEAQQQYADHVKAIEQSASDSITDLLIVGGNTWRDYARVAISAIRDIIREQTNLANPGSGGGGWIGALITAGSAAFGGGKASGGPVAAGTTYMVGENGPEMFTAGSNGTITPNGGGSQVHITIDPSPLFGVAMKIVKDKAVSEAVGAVSVHMRNRGGRV